MMSRFIQTVLLGYAVWLVAYGIALASGIEVTLFGAGISAFAVTVLMGLWRR